MKDLLMLTKVMISERRAILLAIFFGFIAAISSVGLLGTGGYLISQSALHPPLYTLTLTILLVRFFGLARAAGRYAERYFSHKATFAILGRIRVYFFDKIEPLAPALFSTYRSGDILSRVVADVEQLQYYFLRVFYPPFVMVIVFVTTAIFISTFSISIGVSLIIGLLIVGFLIPIVIAKVSEHGGKRLREIRSQLSVEITEFIFGFTDLRVNRRLNEKQREIELLSDELIEAQEKESLTAAKGTMVSMIFAFVVAWVVLLLGVMYVEVGELSGVYLAMMVLVSLTVFETATTMSTIPGHVEESKVAANRLFHLTTTAKTDESSKVKKVILRDEVKISFSNVSFSYPGSERNVLDNFNLLVEPKQKVALIGPSGSGKTSILYLLLKFYKEFEGEIKLGEHSITDLSEENVREFYSVVSQQNHFFNDTVRNNLLLAKPAASDEELYKVLKDVSLTDLSLDAMVNEKGLLLSGGERQRLAIARMILKDAPIVLLDEPTTGLDSITEQEVLKTLWSVLEGKTVLYITHRLVGLEKLDQIIALTHEG